MRETKAKILLFWAFFALCIGFNIEAKQSSTLETEIEAKLKQLNKPAVKTIKSEDGDIIDCVNIYDQPAFDHPALKNHTIKMMPDYMLKSEDSSTEDDSETEIFQTWQESGSCPKGTIPIRRILREDLLRADSLHSFGRKFPQPLQNLTANQIKEFIPQNRSSAYLVTMGYNYIGSQADINVWNPKVPESGEFTTAQIWLKNNNNPYFESVESGWMVNPKLYRDGATRFFAYWTRDSYRSTGCFDLTCSGFVQTGQVVLGGTIKPISSRWGQQYDINVGMFLDAHTGNWYLKVNKNTPVGYWPAEILSSLRHSAILVEWGGQVASSNIRKKTPHTTTQMGSGDFADGRFKDACFMRNIRIMDYSLQLKYPSYVSAMADEPYCYSALNEAKYGAEPIFYFGGPGRRPPYCP
ncbi:hypothetical protein LR48_Vigan04g238000 [Vigna angularis]|uniref:Neprosin PEP catalytic domain-containing protein n=2 Tax=Phaseolus angularis TaxID=3914 RepID=A0A0L9UHZ7_PHAAN|nr:uncharacterized protein LOC108330826 [Vigna angularis]KAG2400457.1 uncharacterized protein HKW66_Vig0096890 [Vigna angularis]KOM42182.1 hypothetical protein LR48_Vigan04g238000 [Vigna angularis]BAT77957.1 hypothetical protein VIGAN_02057500 [Vigna angularis var. angularis]